MRGLPQEPADLPENRPNRAARFRMDQERVASEMRALWRRDARELGLFDGMNLGQVFALTTTELRTMIRNHRRDSK